MELDELRAALRAAAADVPVRVVEGRAEVSKLVRRQRARLLVLAGVPSLAALVIAVIGLTALTPERGQRVSAGAPAPAPAPFRKGPAAPAPTNPPTNAAAEAPRPFATNTRLQFVDRTHGWMLEGGNERSNATRILATVDGGRTWTSQHDGLSLPAGLQFVDSTHGWVVAGGQLLRTGDGGRHWIALDVPTAPLVHVSFANREVGWAVTVAATLVATVDGGDHWTPMAFPAEPQAVCFSDSHTGWVASPTALRQTADGGRTWTIVFDSASIAAAGAPVGVDVTCRSQRAWASWTSLQGSMGAPLSLVARTDDAGDHWRVEPAFQSAPELGPDVTAEYRYSYAADPGMRTEVAVAAGPGAGGDPQLRTIPSLEMPWGVWFVDAGHGWVAGDDPAQNATGIIRGAVLSTSDGGRTWRRIWVSDRPHAP